MRTGRAPRGSSEDGIRKQEAVFNSMVEGLLILDERRAHRARLPIPRVRAAFVHAAGQHYRGLTLLEALRMHELDEIALRALQPGGPRHRRRS